MGKLPTANKDLGQHFLKDQKVIQSITQDFAEICDVIVEVGPGPAILSRYLCQHGKNFYIIELDRRFSEYLQECLPENRMFFTDALNFDWSKFITDHKLENKKIWLVSNLPYNISAPLFTSFMAIEQIQYMSLMFQKEVGEKTYWRENAKNQMSSLLALSLNYFESRPLCKVLPGAFLPPPKVDSVVVSYQRKEQATIALSHKNEFEKFLRDLFRFKRKQMAQAFKHQFSKDQVQRIFQTAKIDEKRRAETLQMAEIYTLFDSYILHK